MRIAAGVLALALTTALSAAPRVALPTLTSDTSDGKVSLAIDALRVHVLVRGHLARTTFEITFRNELDRDLDGQFSFPLPLDAEVSDLGLYFDGVLRHGVAVERVQARAAYEETVHRRVDPALAEWSASTRAFRFRVYPIPARGTKVVHIAYDQDIATAPYELDLRYGLQLSAFDLSIDSDSPVDKEEAYVRVIREPSEVALAAWSPSDRSWYYSAPPRIQSNARPLAPASAVTLLYDVSWSAVQRDDEALRAFLRGFLALQRQDGVRVTVVPFHINVDAPFETDAVALEHRLGELSQDGATNLAALLEQLPAIAAKTPADSRIVLVTDGMHTIGDSRGLARAIDSLRRLRRPIVVVNASPSADDTVLARLAAATGGWSVDLTRTSAADAAASAMRLPRRVSVLSVAPGIREVLPQSLTITADVTTTVHARGQQQLSWLPVTAGGVRRELPVRELASEEERDLVRRSWGRAALRELLENDAPAADVLAHGLRFQQLTPQTSLLILDTWQDYERYGIPLPPDLRVQKARELAQQSRNAHGIVLVRSTEDDAWFIRGIVTEGGAPLPGVTVHMLVGEVVAATTVTDAEGRFRIRAAQAPARFELRASLEGFHMVTQSFPRGAAKGTLVELQMSIAAVAETITVTAASPAVNAGAQMASRGASFAPADVEARIGAVIDRLGGTELTVRALTDLAEAWPDDAPTLRLIGRVLDGWGHGALARSLFERALELSPREEQTQRELALLKAKEQRGIDRRRDERVDLQVELMWDTNYTDVDLHVLEPSGEEVSYQNLTSKNGGVLHEDITDGFGPETYTLPHMEAGTYEIALEFYAHDDTSAGVAALAHVIVYVRGERRDFFVALTGEKERVVVARVTR